MRRARAVMRAKTPRVFIGLAEIAGQFSSIETALRDFGVDAKFHNLSPDIFRYRGGRSWSVDRLRSLRRSREGTLGGTLWRLALAINRVIRRARAAALFPFAAICYDAFILGGQETFLGGFDLRILRRLRKPVVIIFTGSDHRPPFLSSKGMRLHTDHKSMIRASRRLSQRVHTAERWATAIVALPASAQFHRRDFIDFLAIGIPIVTGVECEPSTSVDATSPVRVLHCPTDPVGKGSDRIRTAIDRVRARGVPIEYREIAGRPNDEVLRAIRWCDFVIDELYSDTPMAKFGAEAARFGKPAIVGTYAADLYRPTALRSLPPSRLCHPELLEDAVHELATDTQRRLELGFAAQRFVTHEWAPSRVADRLMRLISATPRPDWIVHPSEVGYAYGWGMPEAIVAGNVAELLSVTTLIDLGIPAGTRLEANLRELAAKAHKAGTEGSRHH